MRYREATPSDVLAIAKLFGGRNALPLEPAVREALPDVLHRVIASPACHLTVFEEEDRSGLRVISFAGGLFPRPEVLDAYLSTPFPAFLSRVLTSLHRGEAPLLTLDDIRRANSGAGHDLAIFPLPLGTLDWSDARVEQLRKLAPRPSSAPRVAIDSEPSTTKSSRTKSPPTCSPAATGCFTTSRHTPAPGSFRRTATRGCCGSRRRIFRRRP